MPRGPYVDGRIIAGAKVIAALDRFDLKLLLWAVSTRSRARVLAALVDGPATARRIIRRTGVPEVSVWRALKELVDARLVVSRRRERGPSGKWVRVYEIASGRRSEAP